MDFETGSRMRRLALLSLTVLTLFGTTEARAGFSYTSTPTITSITGGSLGHSTISLTSVSSFTTQTTPTYENLFNVADTSTTTVGTNMFTVHFSDTITITNIPPPGVPATNSLTITGTLMFRRSDINGEVSFLNMTPGQNLTLQVDGEIYTLSDFTYARPTVNSPSGAGNVSALIDAISVPEPASVAMLGLGLVGLGFFYRCRSLAK